jgi:hypothetical protein
MKNIVAMSSDNSSAFWAASKTGKSSGTHEPFVIKDQIAPNMSESNEEG